MARLTALAAALSLLSGCAVMLPQRCRPGYHPQSIPTDLGPIYVCRRADDCLLYTSDAADD